VRALGGFTLRTGAMATRVLFDGTRASGVEYRGVTEAGAPAATAFARREVILSAGAFRSPQA